MSGHSHYATIKRQKETKDAARGNLFSKLSKMIQIAIKTGGGPVPESNFKLRVAIEKAKSFNMPKDNIERILKSAQSKMESIEEVVYEGFGPCGVAVIVETATDNRNRTGQEIKNIFERVGGSLGGPGSVSYNFENKGYLLIKKMDNTEDQTLSLIDMGVDDVEETDEGIEVYTQPEKLKEVRENVETAGMEILKTELRMEPKNYIELSKPEDSEKITKFLDTLEEHDDVQRVFSNF